MAIQVNGTEVISNSRALKNIASVDATSAAAMTAAGVGAAPAKTWEYIGAINYGNRSNGVNVSQYWTLPSKYQDGFEGDVLVYGTATSINQGVSGDYQYANIHFGDHSYISTGSSDGLLRVRPRIQYRWQGGGSRDVTSVKFWFAHKLTVAVGNTFFGSDEGPSGLEINGSGWIGDTSFTGGGLSLGATYYGNQAQKYSSSNGNFFTVQDVDGERTNWIPQNDNSWNRRIYADLETSQLQFTGFILSLYINSDL